MNSYTNIKETPLKFHRLYSAFILPLDLFLNIYSIISIVMVIIRNGASIIDYIGVGETIVFLALILLSLRGLLLFRKSSLVAVLALQLVQIIDNGFSAYLYIISDNLMYGVSSIISIGILFLIFFYYFKRRNLFSSMGLMPEEIINMNKVDNKEAAVDTEIVEEEKEEEIGEYDCPRCGYHITNGSVFCPKCGAQTRAVR